MKLFFLITMSVLVFGAIMMTADKLGDELSAAMQSTISLSINSLHVRLEKKIAAMSLEEKIGQMMMVAIPGKTLKQETAQWLRAHHIGGVILLGGNVSTQSQVKQFIRDLQVKARDADDPPLFIAVDQEGGEVSRFLFLDELTAQRDITDVHEAFGVAQRRGIELKEMGVNINFSPVMDIASSRDDFISKRVFRGDSSMIASLGTAMIRGYQNAGIISTAKHFPGHGNTSIDSHKDLPTMNRGKKEIETALLPFYQAVNKGVPIVMMGHIKIPEIDPDYPASLSFRAIDILRHDLHYNGLIITDDLGMGAVTRSYSLSEAAIRSIQAGVDVILLVRNSNDYDKVYKDLLYEVQKGNIKEHDINQRIEHILSLKEKF